jgi:uncharacterized protein (TIGR02246 family)
MKAQLAGSADQAIIIDLYYDLLESWNHKSAGRFAFLFSEDANVIGFDGSQMNGRAEIEIEMLQIFANYDTGTYVTKIREVRFLSKRAALLRAVTGMIPAGEKDIKPEINAIQTMIAIKTEDRDWKIAVFQNTPAQFHGRPELAEELTKELKALAAAERKAD